MGQGNGHGRFAIVGTGQMGLVGARILESRGISCSLWGRNSEHVEDLRQLRESRIHLPGYSLGKSILVTADAAEAFKDAEAIVCAVPTQYIRTIFGSMREHVPANVPIVSFSKGIENKTLLRPTQIIADVLHDDPDKPARPLACLCGPTIADELARCLPATMIAASDDAAFSQQLQSAFTTNWMRIYTHEDLLGVELAGATKNVIALAAGMIDGLQAGINAKSALLARGLAEITRLGAAMGASPDTFFGISGVGDLATTCFSPLGRNRTCGEELGKGKSLDEILESTESVVEGVATTRSVQQLALKFKVEMPIAAAVHAILFEGLDPIEAISGLMSREPKAERIR